MKRYHAAAWAASVVATVVLTTSSGRAQEPELGGARELYASAAYDDALDVLNRLRSSTVAPAQSRTIEQYRALCLLALGRTADAEQAIEAVVLSDPSYQPAQADVSPRVRAAFADVRRRMLPGIIQQQYARAKSAFDRKDFATAAAAFSHVLVTLADPGISAEAMQPPLSDLRTLAVGFEELSAKAAAPPPAPVAPPPPPVVAPEPPAPPRTYSAEDRDVIPPAIINQAVPSYPGNVLNPRMGRIEVVIDESGAVESAVMAAPITSAYDKLALAATKAWRYSPATVNGRPVKYRKVVQIAIKPTT